MAEHLKVMRIAQDAFVVTRVTEVGEALRVEPRKAPYTTRQAANRRKWQLEAEAITVIIKASMQQSDHPVWAEIRRSGNSMNNPRDLKMRMGLSDEQETAYLAAYQHVKDGDVEAAEVELKKCFDWVKVEQ